MAYARKTPKNGKGKITKTDLTPINAVEGILKVDELESVRFAQLDAELRNHLQMIRIIDLEHAKAETDLRDLAAKHQHAQAQRVSQKQFYETQVGLKKKEYLEFVTGLGKKYGLDHTKMSIDPETRTIRDLTKDTQS